MAKNRRADAVVFGFDFQVNAAIVLMLENITELKSLRLEGNYEDIELELNDNHYILAQAKSIEKSSTDFRNVRSYRFYAVNPTVTNNFLHCCRNILSSRTKSGTMVCTAQIIINCFWNAYNFNINIIFREVS